MILAGYALSTVLAAWMAQRGLEDRAGAYQKALDLIGHGEIQAGLRLFKSIGGMKELGPFFLQANPEFDTTELMVPYPHELGVPGNSALDRRIPGPNVALGDDVELRVLWFLNLERLRVLSADFEGFDEDGEGDVGTWLFQPRHFGASEPGLSDEARLRRHLARIIFVETMSDLHAEDYIEILDDPLFSSSASGMEAANRGVQEGWVSPIDRECLRMML